jgi:hypothetical protein
LLLEESWPACTNVPAELRRINLIIPVGYAHSPGSYESCLQASSATFQGKYCPVSLSGPPELSNLAPDNLGRSDSLASHSDTLNFIDQLQILDPNSFLVPDLENFAKILSSSKHMAEHLKRSKKETDSNLVTFSILKPELISKYITELSIIYMQPQDTAYISFDQNNIYLALLALYSAVNHPLTGLCIPSTCSEADVNLNYLNIIQNLTKGNLTLVPTALTLQCYTEANRTAAPNPMPGVDKLIYIVFVTILILIICKTILDLVDKLAFPTPLKRRNIIPKSVLSFSAYTNSLHLLSTETVGLDHLDCMNGMRFLSMTWVVLGHSFFIILIPFSAVRNILAAPEIMGGSAGLAFEAVLNATPSVDSFFIMSGTLTAYVMFKELEKAKTDMNKHIVVFLLYYVHRYLRLTITYALVMGVIIAVVPHVYYGPGWLYVNTEAESCKKNGWAHFLYVNSLLKNLANDKDLCMGVSWYLVDDMIFHWFSPLILYPMFLLWQKTQKHLASFSYWLAVLTSFTCGVTYIAYTTEQPPANGVSSDDYKLDYTYQVDFYFVPWARY